VNLRQQVPNTPIENRVVLSFPPAEVACDVLECRGEIATLFTREFVLRSPLRLESDSLVSLRMVAPVEAFTNRGYQSHGIGHVVSERRLQDGTLGYLVQMEVVFSTAL